MARTVGIGIQSFGKIIENNCFYVDKTAFIKEWWESYDDVTLITRPRRFGKTLTMSMLDHFFSVDYAGRGDLFGNLAIWKEEKYRGLQGSYPVIFLSFADIKEISFSDTRKKICHLINSLYNKYDFLLESGLLNEDEKQEYRAISAEMEDYLASKSLNILSEYLSRYYGKKVIILLDEYDTPMQEAYIYGYWEEMAAFIRSLFNSTFKTNPYLERAIMTGVTRISKESIFSDLNHLEVVTSTIQKYEDVFGFTEEEVYASLEEFSREEEMRSVKYWYDGFVFGKQSDIYNPWSIINYLDKGQLRPYWANTSSNGLVGTLIRQSVPEVKRIMENLLTGGKLYAQIDEQVVFTQLDQDENAIWSLLLASGYLKAESCVQNEESGEYEYELSLTNNEVRLMFERLIRGWFGRCAGDYNQFVRALLAGNLEDMNGYMSDIACELFSSFDGGTKPSERTHPERFYHGFVLGLLVELKDRYVLTSNGESGYGRYDIILEPKTAGIKETPGHSGRNAAINNRERDAIINNRERDAIIIEFKVVNSRKKESLEEGVESALAQIEKMQYETILRKKGIPAERIRKYGFAFEGKQVLIG
ncbi:MAG: AAA family ATPase [Lachnospiraceae bacterium]|jgi:hypothetical protein|nr:AAA family ATPase [Lachnospiraceae bacterium]